MTNNENTHELDLNSMLEYAQDETGSMSIRIDDVRCTKGGNQNNNYSLPNDAARELLIETMLGLEELRNSINRALLNTK